MLVMGTLTPGPIIYAGEKASLSVQSDFVVIDGPTGIFVKSIVFSWMFSNDVLQFDSNAVDALCSAKIALPLFGRLLEERNQKYATGSIHPARIQIVFNKMLEHFLYPDPNGFKAQLVAVD
jgi:hypothetical protein